MKHFDDTHYTGDPNYNWQNEEGQEGFMETFSPHEERVHELFAHIEKGESGSRRIWTIVAGDDGNFYIVAGYSFVNRVMYFISNERWQSIDEQYLWHESEEDNAEIHN